MTNDKTPEIITSQSTIESKKRLQFLKNRRLVILIIVLIAIAAAGAWFGYKKYNENKRPDGQAYVTPPAPSFAYDNENPDKLLVTHLLQGNSSGAGISFKLPLNGIVYADSPTDRSDPRLRPAKLTDTITDKGNEVKFGGRFSSTGGITYFHTIVAARIVPPSEKAKFDKANHFKGVVNEMAFKYGDNPTVLGMAIGSGSNFTNNSIISGAKIYPILFSLPDNSVKTGRPVHRVAGELVEVQGKKADYYLLIVANESNLDAGLKTWQAIKNSIKVDQ